MILPPSVPLLCIHCGCTKLIQGMLKPLATAFLAHVVVLTYLLLLAENLISASCYCDVGGQHPTGCSNGEFIQLLTVTTCRLLQVDVIMKLFPRTAAFQIPTNNSQMSNT